jgi:geranylgeranyl diphosphate synthase type 3
LCVDILKQKTEDVDIKKFALHCMEQTRSFEYTRGVLRALLQELQTRIAELGGNPPLEHIIKVLAESGSL